MSATPPVFDGHNDVLLKLWRAEEGGQSPEDLFIEGCGGHLDLPRIQAGGLGGGFFACFAPNDDFSMGFGRDDDPNGYSVPLPDDLPRSRALEITMAEAGILLRLQARGALSVVRTAAEIETCLAEGRVAAILHIEGAEAIDPELRVLDVLEAAGLRSLGPVWSRNNIFAHGAPFRFPSTPDTGPGLTELGRELVRECDRRGIMIDLSHITETGFWDVAEVSSKPLVATHSNAHAICPHARNLTDRQLDAIRERDGMVGVNLATGFLRPDGRMAEMETLDPLIAHFAYLVERVGEDRVGLGSDFDGARIPSPIRDAAGLPALREALEAAGMGGELLEKLCWKNWTRVLRATWGA
ncbi:dipeptidase [Albimonas pacifica]|uniref:Dipeptidase AC. Metallo peptidase. MEROPS family M19 n=1 Tax=Albimonas pacifica TaxID=1114924 RepID=A0A1I3GJ92_9RHOB|nr:dipeptidase [Albimonas pacifica]SFI23558.1 dipeptidase AC. Metallo peptidase. MEROPS family M19 [Albimonas pacifica]